MTQCRGVEVAFVPHMVNHRKMMRLCVPIKFGVIGEGGSGSAHCDYDTAATNLGAALRQNLERGMNTPVEELLKKRCKKFRALGNFAEGKATSTAARS
jgi:acetyl-CoA carboxylase alpha subunit